MSGSHQPAFSTFFWIEADDQQPVASPKIGHLVKQQMSIIAITAHDAVPVELFSRAFLHVCDLKQFREPRAIEFGVPYRRGN